MATIVSMLLSAALLSGLLAMIATLVAGRWRDLAAILADGASTTDWDRDQLVLPLRFAA
jgi:hypothetical protein